MCFNVCKLSNTTVNPPSNPRTTTISVTCLYFVHLPHANLLTPSQINTILNIVYMCFLFWSLTIIFQSFIQSHF